MFAKVLIASRGEIAVRIARTCHDLGVEVVAVHSDVDGGALHVAMADEAVRLPGIAPAETYMNVGAILQAAVETGAEAIHPGYGFLSERPEFAEATIRAGLAWVGPPPEAARVAGDKVAARMVALEAGVEPVPGTAEQVGRASEVVAFGREYGYPIAIKAAAGGGGRGLRVVNSEGEVEDSFASAARESEAYFGSGDLYLERYLERSKHLEVQVLAPAPGRSMWLGARDCSLQRRNQKLVEETPPPRFTDLVPELGEAAVAVADACGYVGAGTIEFLVDTEARRFYFMEINARLQVEHTVTEAVLGLDMVAAQLRIAAGEPIGASQMDLGPGGEWAPRGHAIECRINAEDPARRFLPAPGKILRYREPGGPGVRVDSGFGQGDEIPAAYDSLIAKLVVWGRHRDEARRRALRALDEFVIEGVPTTIAAHRLLLASQAFVDGSYHTATVEGGILEPLSERGTAPAGSSESAVGAAGTVTIGTTQAHLWHPAMARSAPGAGRRVAPSFGQVAAPMQGTILKIMVAMGDRVEAGDPVAILEAMKMETHVPAQMAGRVASVEAEAGQVVEAGQPLLSIE